MDVDDLIYLFEDNAGKEEITLKGETYKYLVKVLRLQENDELFFRNRENIKTLYTYKITNIEGRSLDIKLISLHDNSLFSNKELHLAWCVIDSKSIEKVLPSLNEIGVRKISFIYCDRSQRNFKLDFKRFYRILEGSMQQCGRTHKMELDTYKNVSTFIEKFPDTKVFDFTNNILKGDSDFKRVLIGCEGGFSQNEKEFLSSLEVFRLNTPMVLRSESAAMAVASKILL